MPAHGVSVCRALDCALFVSAGRLGLAGGTCAGLPGKAPMFSNCHQYSKMQGNCFASCTTAASCHGRCKPGPDTELPSMFGTPCTAAGQPGSMLCARLGHCGKPMNVAVLQLMLQGVLPQLLYSILRMLGA